MGAYTHKRIDDLASIHDGLVKLAAAELGVESFGLQVLDLPPGFEHYPEHDHAADGQEEVYVLIRGAAECTVAGERLVLAEGELLRVAPEARRTLRPGPEGARVLAIGCVPGAAYERPADFRVEVGA